MTEMDGMQFDAAKPAKDWNERLENTKGFLQEHGTIIGGNLKVFGGVVKEKGGVAAGVIGQKAGTLKEKI